VIGVWETFRNKTKVSCYISLIRRQVSNDPFISSNSRFMLLPRGIIDFGNAAQQLLASSKAPFSLDFTACFP
jgi:hypothetical protein